jgi:hypothetical protein
MVEAAGIDPAIIIDQEALYVWEQREASAKVVCGILCPGVVFVDRNGLPYIHHPDQAPRPGGQQARVSEQEAAPKGPGIWPQTDECRSCAVDGCCDASRLRDSPSSVLRPRRLDHAHGSLQSRGAKMCQHRLLTRHRAG